ncbi:MAG: 3-methyl-2-oxobutanoate hydroxymethyltransferase [Zetaproteobacteria bacterium]|nr:MAG: 3-methyl-2-oxobutanoate hydroxymethyltransferase [Zetaproteobacteria bacterium]
MTTDHPIPTGARNRCTPPPFTARTLRRCKREGRPLCWLTAYDATQARIAEEAGVDVLLVGDSVGMVSLGFSSTIPVTLEMICHHAAAVVRGRRSAWVVADLPFGSYQRSPQQALESAVRVVQHSGCDAVKLEGGAVMVETVRFLSERGIAVVGHLGLLPQSIARIGGYRRQATEAQEARALLHDARALCEAGALALVLESIPAELAARVTGEVAVPTIGIGAGGGCDGQVLVWHDLLGLSDHPPPFAPAYAEVGATARRAIADWCADVRARRFPCG